MRVTGDRATGKLLGICNCSATATPRSPSGSTLPPPAIFHGMAVDDVSDLDLSYTPPLGSPWEAVQIGTQAWVRHAIAARSVCRCLGHHARS